MSSSEVQPIPAARPVIGEEEIEAAVRVLRTGRVVQGPEVAAFEEGFAELVAGRHCVAVNSGTSALHLLLLALGIGPGDEVIVPSFSFAASANAVRLVGADVVFADIEPGNFGLDPAAVEAAITPRTAAIMPVHLYGNPASMDKLMPIADKHKLAVVEDACQAHAASLHGTPVGAFGSGGTFSFYPTKNMHSLEGGMISTGDAEVARTLRLLRNQGMEQRYANEIVGANMRLTDVAAAIGRVQLTKLGGWTEQRRANAAYLTENITAPGVVTPRSPTARTTSTTSTPSGSPGTATPRWRSSPRRASATPCTTRPPSTGCGRSGSRTRRPDAPGSCRRPSGPPPRSSRCPCTPRCPSPTWSESSPP